MRQNLQFTVEQFEVFNRLFWLKYKIEVPYNKEKKERDGLYYRIIQKVLKRTNPIAIQNQFYSPAKTPSISRPDFDILCRAFDKIIFDEKILKKYFEAGEIRKDYENWKEEILERFKEGNLKIDSKDILLKSKRLRQADSDYFASLKGYKLTKTPWADRVKIKKIPVEQPKITNDKFRIALATLAAYYKQHENEFLHEEIQFNQYENMASLRSLSENNYFNNAERNIIIKDLLRKVLALYELNINTITKRTIVFKKEEIDIENTSEGFTCSGYYEDKDRKTKSPCIFEYNVNQNSFFIIDNYFLNRRKKYFEAYYLKFHKKNIYVGHKLIYYPKTHVINSKFVILNKENRNVNRNSPSKSGETRKTGVVPDYIKSLLLCPDEIEIDPKPFVGMNITFEKILNIVP